MLSFADWQDEDPVEAASARFFRRGPPAEVSLDFPARRVRSLMLLHSDSTTNQVTPDAVRAMSYLAELFARAMAVRAGAVASLYQRSIIKLPHLFMAVKTDPMFDVRAPPPSSTSPIRPHPLAFSLHPRPSPVPHLPTTAASSSSTWSPSRRRRRSFA